MQASVTAAAVGPDQITAYVEQGYLVVESLLNATEIEELKTDLVHLARGEYISPALTPLPASLSDAEALSRILCIHQPHFVSPVVREYTRHPLLTSVLAQVVGAHLPQGWWDGNVKCMQSMAFAKPPGKPGQAWHQDEAYIPTRDRSLCGAWIALDDADQDNGCLWVLPGSHRPGILYPQRPHQQPAEFDESLECIGFDDSAAQPVEVAAGSVVFFNGYLLHRSLRNRSSRSRRALVNHYMSAQSLLPWQLEQAVREGTVANLASADNRAVHLVAGTDPHAARGYRVAPERVHLRCYKESPQ